MNPAGCKSDQSNQFFHLEIWKPRPGASIRIAVALGFRPENGSALIKALKQEAGVQV
jgi:hypothetical protein